MDNPFFIDIKPKMYLDNHGKGKNKFRHLVFQENFKDFKNKKRNLFAIG